MERPPKFETPGKGVGRDTLVVGGVDEGPAAVFVSEYAENIRRSVRADVLLQLLVLTILGIAAAMIVNATLLRVLAQPVTRLAATVDSIATASTASRRSRRIRPNSRNSRSR